MSYTGTVHNGVVVLDDQPALPEGARVEVHVVHKADAPTDERSTLYERLKDVIGIAKGLPSDLAENHDHYIHGAARK
jgi:hypothetical protein